MEYQIQANGSSSITLIDISELGQHEEHDPAHAARLAEKIAGEGIWKTPIAVDRKTRIVLDGHHRLNAGYSLGCKFVPCVLYDYNSITVASWRQDIPVDRESVIQAGLTGVLLPKKTSKHIFTGPVIECAIPLYALLEREAA